MSVDLAKVPLNPGAKKVVAEIKGEGHKIAIVSSSKKELVIPAVQYHRLDQAVELVLCEEDVEQLKPDPEMIYLALEKLGASKEEAVIIGDTEKDILAGKSAGIATLLYFPDHNKKFYSNEKLVEANPKYQISSFSEVLDLVGNE